MLVSMNWISDFVDLSGLDIEKLISRFTLSTAEVEDIYYKGRDTKNVVLAQIISVEAHPDSKKLHLLKVDSGNGIIDVVCGAPNVRLGMKTALALAGGQVCGNPINTAKVAGYTSCGMCCSEYELGLSADHSGIMNIETGLPLGTDIKQLVDIEDIVFEVDNKSLTNRPDLWGHYGMAREFSALTGRPLRAPELFDTASCDGLPKVNITVSDRQHCFRYSSVKAENISVKVSPLNMRVRLFYCGLRAINLLADLTNYVMLEQGQPMHAFDLRKVDKIEVKSFEESFKFSTLDGVEREIDPATLMICSDGKPVAVAGIMGGLDSEIEDDTSSLLLESANFDAVSVRKSSQRLGLRTDSSMRYEKTLDPELTMLAAARFIKLLTSIDPGAKVISRFSDCYVKHYPAIEIEFDKRYVDRYAGIDISNNRILDTLRALGFKAEYFDGKFKVEVPSWRATKDVTISADIIEEITRVYGYDNFNAVTTRSALRPVALSRGKQDENSIKSLLVDKYLLHEVHSYIWCDGKKYRKLGIDVEENVRILNIPTPELGTLRNSLIPTLAVFASENKGFADSFGIFEIGRVFEGQKDDGSCNERKKLGVFLYGRSEKKLFGEIMGIVCDLCSELRRDKAVFTRTEPTHAWQHPKNTAVVSVCDKDFGYISVLHPSNAEKLDKNASAVFAELDMDTLAQIGSKEPSYSEPSKFPGIDVDLTFEMGEGTCYGDIESAWKNNGCEYLCGATPVDFYEADGVRAITVRLSYSCSEHTLAREEIQPNIDAVTAYLAGKGIKQR